MKEAAKIMTTRSRLLKAVTLGVLMAFAALLLTNPAKAFRPTAVEFHFGSVGITRGQSARLNVLNVSRGTLMASINFTDNAGRMIQQSVEKVEPGQSIFLDLTPTSVDDSAGRLQIHASVEVSSRESGGGAGRLFIPTLEVFDTGTGRTHIALGACDGSV
jgi:hypothetical protein